MATNWRGVFNGPKTEELHIDNIAVGDTLIRADWDFGLGRWNETTWTVAKVLKSRLVLTRVVNRGTAEEPNLVTVDLRVLVRNSKTWAYNNGAVQTRVEGQSEWSRDPYYLFTPEDPNLADLRVQVAEAAADRALTVAARAATERVAKTRYFTKDDAIAAIAALQAWVDNQKED